MPFASQGKYYQKLETPEIKGVLPSARTLAESRGSGFITTTDLFCAILFEDKDLLDKIYQKYGLEELDIHLTYNSSLLRRSEPDPVDDFEQMQVSARLDTILSQVALSHGNITRKNLLRELIGESVEHEVSGFLMNLGLIPASTRGTITLPDEILSEALKNFRDQLLSEEDKQFQQR